MATAEQLNQAIALIQGNQYADAEALLIPLLNQSATDSDVWQLIALARKGQIDLTGAEVAFKQSIDLYPAPAVVTKPRQSLPADGSRTGRTGVLQPRHRGSALAFTRES